MINKMFITIPGFSILLIIDFLMLASLAYDTSTIFCSSPYYIDQICYNSKENRIAYDYKFDNNTKFSFIVDESSLNCKMDHNSLILEDVCSKETIKNFISTNKGNDLVLSLSLPNGPVRLVAKKSITTIFKTLWLFIYKKWFMILITALFGYNIFK